MISRLLLTACLMSIFYSQTSLASVIIDDANIDKGESFNRVPTEVIKAHFIPYVPKTALLLNRGFYWLITGYKPDEVGVQQTQRSGIVPPIFWEVKMFNDQKQRITRVYTPENISPFLWFHLLRYTQNLSNAFWPYLQGTNVHTVNLAFNRIGAVAKSFLSEHYSHITWIF
ncbi:hypothetical protein Cva_00982 [Caedimonas varicaedens]|uniref:Uncharacterized protein n=1 Tax=Caedimonas varicaedens TaxID=1629334 RepID=A0A0K8MDM9_9PROT|nr:hypothetical protein Cva_00982 [Caedimonas varicaedens]